MEFVTKQAAVSHAISLGVHRLEQVQYHGVEAWFLYQHLPGADPRRGVLSCNFDDGAMEPHWHIAGWMDIDRHTCQCPRQCAPQTGPDKMAAKAEVEGIFTLTPVVDDEPAACRVCFDLPVSSTGSKMCASCEDAIRIEGPRRAQEIARRLCSKYRNSVTGQWLEQYEGKWRRYDGVGQWVEDLAPQMVAWELTEDVDDAWRPA